MRNIYRILTVLSVLASVGSFFVALWPFVKSDDKPNAHHGTPKPKIKDSWFEADEPITRDRRERRGQLKALCDWQIYEPIRSRLRDAYQSVQRSAFEAPEWLGADRNYHYFYDFADDDIFCQQRATPGGPLVFAGKADQRTAEQRAIIAMCVMVMAVCGAGLILIQVIRARQDR